MRSYAAGLIASLLAVLCVAPPSTGNVAATPRERIIGYLLFYYVGEPNNDDLLYRPQLLYPEDLLAGKKEADFWRDSDIPGLQELVGALVDEPKDADTRRFQALVADLLDVRGSRVAVYLIDDAGQALADGGAVVKKRYAASVDKTGKAVWPSASDDKALSLEREVLAGSFSAGESNLRSATDARGTFIHELTHVQVLSDAQSHLYFVGGVSFSYGNDGSHHSNELIPNLSMVYDEAAANAMEMLYDPGEVHEALGWLGPELGVVVEKTRPDAKKAAKQRSVAPDVWLYDQIKATGAIESPKKHPDYAGFKIGDLPGRFLLHNETAMAIVLAEAARRTVGVRGLLRSFDRTNQVIKKTRAGSGDVSRLSEQEFARLLTALGGEIAGGTDPTAALASGGPMVHLLPLAYLDYMVARDANTPEEFGSLFNGRLDPDWLSVYWAVGRPLLDEILPAVNRTPRTFRDLDVIESAFAAGNEN